ncbi:unnamed protein product, partial [Vitis vinifera]
MHPVPTSIPSPPQMFSSSNSGNPFQHLPSLFHQSPPFVGHESDDIFLHHHNDLLVDYYGPSNFLPGKRAVKKDRHSKITTAKGPRERRVRLSIKIARKFFDLQDMLGFDKASRTLEWLLMKSKTAIKEVVRMKHSCNEEAKSLSSASECEVVSEMNDAAESGDPQEILFRRKESRAKARARARERTREKMSSLEESSSRPLANHTQREDIIEESIVIKRKLKPNSYFPHPPQNWDINTPSARSSFCAMTNMNLSTEFQVFGKPWEAYNNLSLR